MFGQYDSNFPLRKTGELNVSAAQFHRAAQQRILQIFLLSIIKETTSQSTFILRASLAGNQENLLSKYFSSAPVHCKMDLTDG